VYRHGKAYCFPVLELLNIVCRHLFVVSGSPHSCTVKAGYHHHGDTICIRSSSSSGDTDQEYLGSKLIMKSIPSGYRAIAKRRCIRKDTRSWKAPHWLNMLLLRSASEVDPHDDAVPDEVRLHNSDAMSINRRAFDILEATEFHGADIHNP